MAKEAITPAEMKRFMGVMHEEHLEALKGFKEGFSVINKRLDRHEELLESHTEMIGQLMVDVTELKGDMKEVKNEIRGKISQKDFTKLELRVTRLEAKTK